jgi:uncharacterized protein YbjT (DUF2867 family)
LTSNKPDPSPQKILVAGGSGFIGSRLIKKLAADIHYHEPQSRVAEILCLTRDPESIKDMFDEDIRLVKADVSNYEDLARVMSEQIDIAYYLVHSMEGTSKQWKKFSERDRVAAMNFAKVASEYGVKRIIYLGGLIHAEDGDYDNNKLSEHMRSRKKVGEILQQHSSSKVTIFRAAVILGQGGGSFQMLQYLVERLPVMICPRWVLTKCQPIAVDDVVEYLARCIDVKETEGKTFDIGGRDVLTYLDMMRKYAKILNKSVQVIIIPFLTPRLSSYWVDLVTPVRASLARPLIDSLKHDATVQDDSIRQVIPIQLKSFEEAVREARNEKAQVRRQNRRTIKERSTVKINSKLLMLSLLAMAAIGSTYYIMDGRPEIYHTNWIVLGTLWYMGIAFAIYFLRYGARLGALTAGILGWLTLTFWLIDNLYIVWGTSVIASSPDEAITIRNFIGAGVAALVVATSHNLFHKLR